jgi:hypothetical protein
MSEHDQPVAPNILDRQFEAERPNQGWVGDTTELLVGENRNKLYLAVIVDLFARFVVSAVNDRHLVLKALDMAIRRRCPDGDLLHGVLDIANLGHGEPPWPGEKPRVACHRPANTIEIVLVDVSSPHAEARPTPRPPSSTAAKLPRQRLRPISVIGQPERRWGDAAMALETTRGSRTSPRTSPVSIRPRLSSGSRRSG